MERLNSLSGSEGCSAVGSKGGFGIGDVQNKRESCFFFCGHLIGFFSAVFRRT
jgi:hypothetical protein